MWACAGWLACESFDENGQAGECRLAQYLPAVQKNMSMELPYWVMLGCGILPWQLTTGAN